MIFKHRTALVAAGSIAGVVLAGTAAMGANFGILSQSGESENTTTPTVVTVPETVPVTVTAPTTTVDEGHPVAYQVPGVGILTLRQKGDELSVDSVEADTQWTWRDDIAPDGSLVITFVTDGRTITVTAIVVGGQVAVDVQEVQTVTETAPASSSSSGHYEDDDHEGHEGHDDD